MIYESHRWRTDLLRFSNSLNRARKLPLETSDQSARVERDIMYGFFAVRKLEESDKLTSETERRKRAWIRYPAITGRRMPRHRRQDIDEYFAMERPEKVLLTARELANQVIHSYVFIHAVDHQEKLRGVWLASDIGRKRGLLYAPAWRIILLFRRVAADHPTAWRGWYDRARGDWVYTRTRRRTA